MSQMDVQWNALARRVLEKGWDENPESARAVYADTKEKAPARFVIDAEFKFDNTEAAIAFGKNVNYLNAFLEMEWIAILKSNRLEDLHKVGITFWDNWEYQNTGTIGKAYGYQLGLNTLPFPVQHVDKTKLDPRKNHPVENGYYLLDQIDSLIQGLVYNPFSRRHVLNLMNMHDIRFMKLPPCVWRSEWLVDGDMKLNVKLGARSSDLALGNHFNVIQYQNLQRMICQVVDLEPGFLKFDMGNAHIYDRHIEGTHKILKREDKVKDKKCQLILPPNVRSLYDFNMNDIKLEGYDPEPGIKFIVAE